MDRTRQKPQKQEQNPAVRRWLDNLRKCQETIYTNVDALERLGYAGKFLTYKERADISRAVREAAEADERLDQSDPMDRIWMMTTILSYEKELERLLGWPKELLEENNSKER